MAKALPKIEEMDPNDLEKLIRRILEGYFWIHSLSTEEIYERTQDDYSDEEHDGRQIMVQFGQDGDAHITIDGFHSLSLRFRTPFVGGGRSPRTRNAIILLAYAIMLDNEEFPQESIQKPTTD